MGSKNISLRDDVYRDLKAAKEDDESFSDVIDRLLGAEKGEHPLYDLVGIIDEDEAENLHEHVETFRQEVDEDMERHL